jgi:hypothetical protein
MKIVHEQPAGNAADAGTLPIAAHFQTDSQTEAPALPAARTPAPPARATTEREPPSRREDTFLDFREALRASIEEPNPPKDKGRSK